MDENCTDLRTKFHTINSATLRGSDIKCNTIEKFTFYISLHLTLILALSVRSISVRNNRINSWNAFSLLAKQAYGVPWQFQAWSTSKERLLLTLYWLLLTLYWLLLTLYWLLLTLYWLLLTLYWLLLTLFGLLLVYLNLL